MQNIIRTNDVYDLTLHTPSVKLIDLHLTDSIFVLYYVTLNYCHHGVQPNRQLLGFLVYRLTV